MENWPMKTGVYEDFAGFCNRPILSGEPYEKNPTMPLVKVAAAKSDRHAGVVGEEHDGGKSMLF